MGGRIGLVAIALVAAAAFPGGTAAASGGPQATDEPVASQPIPTVQQVASTRGAHARLGGGAALGSAGSARRRYVVGVEDRVALDAAVELVGLQPAATWERAVHGFSATLDDVQAARLRATRGVTSVEVDRKLVLTGQQASAPWGLDRIDQPNLPLDGLYSYETTGAGVDVYVIDSGLWITHADFGGRIGPGAYWDFGDDTEIWDCDGHGTHVAGTVAGTRYGVAKQARIRPVKVFDCTGSTHDTAVLTALDWVLQDHATGSPAVVNMSFGQPVGGPSWMIDQAVEALLADGITVVAAAGNDASFTCNFTPARVPGVITVAASDELDDDAPFSNFGACNDLFAPGVDIVSAAPSVDDHGVDVMSGTSMAAPHVAGAAAMLLEDEPSASPARIWSLLHERSTKGVLSECCGDPDRLLRIGRDAVVESPPSPPPPTLVPLSPARLLDTRPGLATVDGLFSGVGRQQVGATLAIQVAGRAGVPDDASAVMLNVTAVVPSGPGFLTVFACGAPQPLASSVNYAAGEVVPNAVLAPVGSGGSVCIFTLDAVDIVIDVNGYVPAGGSPTPVQPSRLLDTRASIGRQPAGGIVHVAVAGSGGVPPDASAAMLNVTAVAPAAPGFLTVFACDSAQPLASSVNYAAGQIVPNAVMAPIAADGTVCIFTLAETDVVVDVNGYVPPGGAPNPLPPTRLIDSRTDSGRVAAGSDLVVPVAGRGGVPPDATAVMLNVTAVAPSSAGFLTVYACGEARPLASTVNYSAGQVVPNAALAPIAADGTVCVYTLAESDIVVDVNGWV